MNTLKDIRIKKGLNQNELASKLKINVPTLSLYESGTLPMLEDMINAEAIFDQYLDWSKAESIDPLSKENIIKAFGNLARRYPLLSVLNFIQKNLKQDLKSGDPSRTISHYASKSFKPEPLLLP